MPRSKSSKQWLQEHFADSYVKQAQLDGYRSRAVYKLKEIDEKEHLIQPNMTIVDLGAAPGGWTQYVSQKLQGKGHIIALDILPMAPLANVDFILGDFTEKKCLEMLINQLASKRVDLVLSDMAPNMSGNAIIDLPKAMYLAELAFDFALEMLEARGTLLMKIFHGVGFDDIVKMAKLRFSKVVIRKPQASRARSRETYLLAKGYTL
ncbi:MAG: 23S rRNA (uridine(2552)-2'-O)-methyltransferase RlmE [Legionellaceae bacterium]|nr:23S rRNA (uridine(2552)-2'-O)-methyltransferase RlmE [Legionellaceae bacterium]HAF88128.1 23S rRNA (uridine(2552)-2'-O)-methyltransferase RlmE [Legionellales bacterium]HCA89257.1 23S rRNA (uridine(2552)-2'-O)-methyltransferase RlmE [Legionellales bacterium]